ncbi:MAG: preprotein translocase subunit SecE [Dehalococcoidia bacterium]|nr:preprotein translocase subunit SecE [Dehalococcoidia bacterium]
MTRQVMGGRQIIPRIRGYVGEVISELKKVVWPTREETRRLTVMVIIIAGSIGVFLAVWDYGFSQFMRWIVNLG